MNIAYSKTILFTLVAVIAIGVLVFFLRAPFQAPEEVPENIEQEVVEEPVEVSTPEVVVEEEEVVFERFIIPLSASFFDIADKLKEEGWIKSALAFRIAHISKGGGDIQPGAYKLARTMSAFDLAGVLRGEPYMRWVVIPEGLRKEEVGEMLGSALGWSVAEREEWKSVYGSDEEYIEGVYFPDTYLIPLSESPTEVAERMTARFNERFAPYLSRFTQQNIRWTTGLTLASLVQREAAGREDMLLIAGILWNRLENNMHLNVDATLQYMRGNEGDGWWVPIDVEIKSVDSPFNTYLYRGLPPHPIASPGVDAIEAVLSPEETDCLYYLHSEGEIYCSQTYEEHQERIEEVFGE
ncbi:MAG: endolytic transglycosylase MltG [Candidatus Paceibacterota bacterium]